MPFEIDESIAEKEHHLVAEFSVFQCTEMD